MEKRKYLIQMRFAADASDKARIAECVPQIKRLIERICDKDCVLVWTATDGCSFAFFGNSTHNARWIYQELMTPGQHGGDWRNAIDGKPAEPSPMRRGDDLLVMEIGADFMASGYSKGWTWLQRR